MISQHIDLQEMRRRSKTSGRIKLFAAVALGTIVISLLVLVASRSSEPLSQAGQGTAEESGARVESAINEEAYVRARAADQARWEAMGEHYATLAGLRPESTAAVDQARWEAMGRYYSELAEAAREMGAAADQARWEAKGEYYAALAGLRPERAAAADQARWEAKGEFYQSHSGLVGIEDTNLRITAHYTGLALQQYQLTGNPAFLPSCVSQEMRALLVGAGHQRLLTEVATCTR